MSISIGAPTGRRAFSRDVSQAEVVNTTTETTVYSATVPAGLLGTNKRLVLRLLGDYLNNSGGASTLTVRATYGGTAIGVFAQSITADAGRRLFAFNLDLAALGAANAQMSYGRAVLTSVSLAGNNDGSEQYARVSGSASLAVDSSADQTLAVTVQHSVAASTISFRAHAVHAEVL